MAYIPCAFWQLILVANQVCSFRVDWRQPRGQLLVCCCGCRGCMPVTCTELRVQVGTVKLTGLSQLVLMAAAAAAASKQNCVGSAQLAVPQAPTGPWTAPAAELPVQASTVPKQPAAVLLQVVALLPEKVSDTWLCGKQYCGGKGKQVIQCHSCPEL